MKLKKLLLTFLCILGLSQASEAQTCNACFTATLDTNSVGLINLDATCSTPAFSGNVYYEWFADGVPYAAWPFPYFQIPFSTPGAHSISLVITDASTGCSDSSAQSINIPVNCTATFQPYQSGNYTYFYSNNYSTTASYFWDFGDGNTSTSMTPAHIYSNPGTYNVCLTISDTAFGGCSASWCDSVSVAATTNCYAMINVMNIGPGPNDYLADAGLSQYNPNNVQFIWKLNGVITQQGPSLSYLFTLNQAFTNTLELDIADTNGVVCSSALTFLYPTSSSGCYSCFFHTPLNANVDSVWADASCSNIPAGGSIQWYLDGNVLPQTNSQITLSGLAPGFHGIALYIKDASNAICDSSFQSFTTYAPPCQSCLNITPVAGTTSDYVFDATCNGTGNLVYTWIVDNIYVTSTYNPLFTYSFTQSGTYSVCLMVTDVLTGNTCNSACQNVTVNTPQATLFDLCGTVYKSGNGFFNYTPTGQNEAIVYLVTLAPGGQLDAIDSVLTDANGGYCFMNKPIFDYRIKVALKPSSPDFSINVPTYFQSGTMWYNANVITLANTNLYNKDVYLVPGVNAGGPGIITGNVLQGANKSRSGSALDGLSMILVDVQTNEPVAYTKTEVGGSYSFTNIPLGDYKVYGELLNKSSIPATVNLNSGNPSAANLNFEVNSNVINPTTAFPTSIPEIKNASYLRAYPNPAQSYFELQTEEVGMQIEVIDITGKRIFETTISGNQPLRIATSNWSNGSYWIRYTGSREQGVLKLQVVNN